MKKVVIFTFKGCSRSIFSNPFLVSMLALLIILNRSFPLFFSALVSASPVLVCTAVLLGTLLSFGKPTLPKIQEERTFDTTTLKIGVSDNVVFKRSECVSPKSCHKREVVEEDSLIGNDISTNPQFLEEMSRAMKSVDMVLEERDREMEDFGFEYNRVKGRELEDFGFEYKSEMFEDGFNDKRTLGNQYSLIIEKEDEDFDLENDNSPLGFIDSNVIDIHAVDFPPHSLWKNVNEEEEGNNNDDDEASDLGSGRTESSSPDASMAGIIPMIDELHPLLDEVTPQPANSYHDGSDAFSGSSYESSNESDDDSEHPEEMEVSDDEDGDGDNEEETGGVKENQTKSAISWTDEDQKNLKNLRTSELERNQRQENLIARQKARRAMRMMTETNLIDFDDTDLPFNVPHILTKRTNPFNLQQHSYENMGLPPIPGSAPSLLLPQKNPFALSYDSTEEKPDLQEDYFEQDLIPFQSKEQIFCRHESFNIRPSLFGTNRAEKQDMSRYRPYFVSERLGSEGRSFSSFTRQSSELSDSKMSSAPDTESIDSAEYLKEPSVNKEETSMMKVRTDAEEDITQTLELISKIEDTSELVGHGSESSEDEGSLEFGQVEKRHMIVDEIDMKLHNEDHNGTQTQEFPDFIEGRNHTEEFRISVQSPAQGSYLKITTPLPDDTPQKDPIYDSSPPAFRKNLSSSSVSSGTTDKSENGLLPIMVKRSVSFSERVTELGSWNMKRNKMSGHEMFDGSTGMIPENKSEMVSEGDAEITEQYVVVNTGGTSVGGNMVQDVHLDKSDPPVDKVEQVADSTSVLRSTGAINTAGTSQGSRLILERHWVDDSVAASKQHREIFPCAPSKMSEFGIVVDVWNEVDSTKEEEPNLEASDKMEALLNAQEKPYSAVKTLKGVDVVASDVSRA